MNRHKIINFMSKANVYNYYSGYDTDVILKESKQEWGIDLQQMHTHIHTRHRLYDIKHQRCGLVQPIFTLKSPS